MKRMILVCVLTGLRVGHRGGILPKHELLKWVAVHTRVICMVLLIIAM
jgi:hypothetical protein